MRKLLSLCFVCCCLWVNAQQETMSRFDQATAAYNEGDFKEAAALYESILEEGLHSAELYFNLGNAYYKMNQVGPSIYYYEKALMLDPTDPEIRNNLGFAQNMTLDAFEEVPQPGISRLFYKVPATFTADRWAVFFLLSLATSIVLYLAFRFLQPPLQKRLSFIAGLGFLLLAFFCLAMGLLQRQHEREDQPAIVFAEATKVRAEPNNRSPEAFELHEGTKVQVLERLGDWKKVRLSNGNTGWMQATDLQMLKEF